MIADTARAALALTLFLSALICVAENEYFVIKSAETGHVITVAHPKNNDRDLVLIMVSPDQTPDSPLRLLTVERGQHPFEWEFDAELYLSGGPNDFHARSLSVGLLVISNRDSYRRPYDPRDVRECEEFQMLLRPVDRKEVFLKVSPTDSIVLTEDGGTQATHFFLSKNLLSENGTCPRELENQKAVVARQIHDATTHAQEVFDEGIGHLELVSEQQSSGFFFQTPKGQQFYKRDELAALFDSARGTLLFRLTDGRTDALRTYIDRKFPSSRDVWFAASNGVILAKKLGDGMIDSARKAFRRLLTVSTDVALDLTVETDPSFASVILLTEANREIIGHSEMPIRCVYRGIYTYTISMEGYRDISHEINFIDQPGNILDCGELIPVTSPRRPAPCDLR